MADDNTCIDRIWERFAWGVGCTHFLLFIKLYGENGWSGD
jgi:hypothetical protein